MVLGKEAMPFEDFERLVYVTEALGLENMNMELWNMYAGQFEEELEKEACECEKGRPADYEYEEDEEAKREKWLMEFVGRIPDEKSRILIKDVLKISN